MKRFIKVLIVLFGLSFIANASYGISIDVINDDYDLISALNVINLIAWPIIILAVTGLFGKILDWWGRH